MRIEQSRKAIHEEDLEERDHYEQDGRESEAKQPGVSRLVLDVLKPREITIIQLGEGLARVDGVSKVSIASREVDSDTETLRISLEGSGIDYGEIVSQIENFGATVRSVDEVILER